MFRDPQVGTPGLLNVPYSTFAGASVARGATHSGRPFRRFATSRCEKCGLAKFSSALVFPDELVNSLVKTVVEIVVCFLPGGRIKRITKTDLHGI